MKQVPEIVTKSLRYEFTAEEVAEKAMQLAEKTKEKQQVIEKKKTADSGFNTSIKEIDTLCNQLSEQITSGGEVRDVEVKTIYHSPKDGKKTMVRLDTMVEEVTDMEPFEFNLFNQSPGNHIEGDNQEEDPESVNSPEYTPETLPKGKALAKNKKKAV